MFRRSDLIHRIGLPAVRSLVRDGRLLRYSRNILIDRRHQFALRTRAAAALLFVGPGSALTGHTAALLYGCSAADPTTIHVRYAGDREMRYRPEIKLCRGPVHDDEVLELDGLRTLGLEIVTAELLCTVHRPVALACADQALAALDPPFRDRFRAEVAACLRTRRGKVLLDLATGLPESPAESQLLLTLYDAGLPIPTPQYRVRNHRLDFAWEELRVALEYDGRDVHEHRAEADAARDADLRSRGWTVIRATAADLRSPARLIHTLRSLLTTRRFVA